MSVKESPQSKQMTAIRIRSANENDIPGIHMVISKGFWGLQRRGYSKKAIEAAIPSRSAIQQRLLLPKTVVFVAANEDQIIGTVTGSEKFEHFHVQSFAVDPRFQGHRVGYSLMTELEKSARQFNCKKLFVQTAWAMFEAIKLYLKLDFELEGYHPRHFFGEVLLSFGKILKPSKNGNRV